MKRLIKKSELMSNIEKDDTSYNIYANPTFNEFNDTITNSYGFVNALIDNSKLYIWDPILSYDEVINHLGYGNDGTKLTIDYDKLNVDDSLGYDYTFQQLLLVKDIICNMISKDEYTIEINLQQQGYNGKMNNFFEGGAV